MRFIYYDIESYPNYFLVHFVVNDYEETHSFRCFNSESDLSALAPIFDDISDSLFIGFNNSRYDAVLLDLLLLVYRAKATMSSLIMYKLTQKLIEQRVSPWLVRKEGKIPVLTYQLDTLDNLPSMGRIGLKECGIRIGHEILETLPYKPGTVLTLEQCDVIDKYCANDVLITYKLAKGVCKSEINGRFNLIENFFNGNPAKASRTTGQLVSEYLIGSTQNRYVQRKKLYTLPKKIEQFVTFKHPKLQEVLNDFLNLDISKETTYKKSVTVYGITLDFGLGGLHACKSGTFIDLIDNDATSYYPTMMVLYNFFPDFISAEKCKEYAFMLDERVRIKKSNPELAGAMKLILNTTFGNLKFKSSPLYCPLSLYNVTITGQLLLAKLVEDLSLNGYEVTTVNTDGVTNTDKRKFITDLDWNDVCRNWEKETGLTLEDNRLDKTIMRDVNNYLWLSGGKAKVKGVFGTDIRKKAASHMRIKVDAVTNYLTTNEPIDVYIKRRHSEKVDPIEWLLYHKYGKTYDETKVVSADNTVTFADAIRYTLSKSAQNEIIAYKKLESGEISEKRSELTDNVRPVFDLADFSWDDIDVERYIEAAEKMLDTLVIETYYERRERLDTLFTPALPVSVREFFLSRIIQPSIAESVEIPCGNGLIAIECSYDSDVFSDLTRLHPDIFTIYLSNRCYLFTLENRRTFRPRKDDPVKVMNSDSLVVNIDEEKVTYSGNLKSENIDFARFLRLTERGLERV